MVLRSPVGLSLAALGLLVVLIYFLRRQPRPVHVPALFLWERLPPGQPRWLSRLFPQLDLLLLLQLAAVAALAVGAADPARVGLRPGGATLLVLDASASMSAQGVADQTRQAAQAVVQATGGPWAVISWAQPTEVLVPLTPEPDQVRAALDRYRPGLAARPPLSHALTLLPHQWARIVIITDRPPSQLPPRAELILIPSPNEFSLTAFAVRPQPDGSGFQLLVRVRNHTDQYQDLPLVVQAGETRFFQALLLPPRAEETLFLPYYGPLGEGLVAELAREDGFPWDNRRYFAPGLVGCRVRWLGQQQPYLWAALVASGGAELALEPPWDLTVAVGTSLEEPPPGPALLVEAGTPEAPLGPPQPPGEWSAQADPLLGGVDVSDWVVPHVRPVELPEGAQVALLAGELPAVARWESAAGKRVLLTFPIHGSSLPASTGFPLLVRNVLQWLLPWRTGAQYVVGESVALPPGAEVLTPAGPASGVWVPEAPGLYEVRRGGRRELVAVNLPPADQVEEGGALPLATPTLSEPVRRQDPVWGWFAGLALALLLAEGLLAQRRG
jgi:hypothetical protein